MMAPEHGFKYIGHIAMGCPVQAAWTFVLVPFAFALWMGWINAWQFLLISGYIANVAHWYSRERRDTDGDLGLNPHRDYFKKLNPRHWLPATRWDFYAPAGFWGIATAVACYFLR